MSRRLVAGLVALVALGGVFAYGLSKQDDVSGIDTKNVTVPPAGFQPFAAAPIAGSTLEGRHVLAREPARQAGVHQLLGDLVRALQGGGAASCASSPTVSATGPHSSVWPSIRPRRRRSFARTSGWRYPNVRKDCCDLGNRYGVCTCRRRSSSTARGRWSIAWWARRRRRG